MHSGLQHPETGLYISRELFLEVDNVDVINGGVKWKNGFACDWQGRKQPETDLKDTHCVEVFFTKKLYMAPSDKKRTVSA